MHRLVRLYAPVLLTLAACRPASETAAPDSAPQVPAAAADIQAIDDPHAIFRRAFWRRPEPDDVVLRAVRVDPSGPGEMWSWALAVRPSPALLAALRDPETLGLRLLAPDAPPPPPATDQPDWFPARMPGDEALAVPGGHLLEIFRPSEGVLYARDHGRGFTPPAR